MNRARPPHEARVRSSLCAQPRYQRGGVEAPLPSWQDRPWLFGMPRRRARPLLDAAAPGQVSVPVDASGAKEDQRSRGIADLESHCARLSALNSQVQLALEYVSAENEQLRLALEVRDHLQVTHSIVHLWVSLPPLREQSRAPALRHHVLLLNVLRLQLLPLFMLIVMLLLLLLLLLLLARKPHVRHECRMARRCRMTRRQPAQEEEQSTRNIRTEEYHGGAIPLFLFSSDRGCAS